MENLSLVNLVSTTSKLSAVAILPESPRGADEVEIIYHLPLTSVFPARYNHRAEFFQEPLEELANSIKHNRVIQPIIVRPIGTVGNVGTNKYEIVSGERRYRASKIAGKTTIPAVIRELTDEDALITQLLENCMREDPHALDEASGYEKLVEYLGFTREDLANKVGKSLSYIDSRLKLVKLIPELKEAFYKGEINLTHAILLAKLPAAGQKDCLRWIHQRNDRGFTAKDLEQFITSNVECGLKAAVFPLDDVTLYPKAGACINCSKRSGCNVMFAEAAVNDRCFDKGCFNTKTAKFTDLEIQRIIADTENSVCFLVGSQGKDDEKARELREQGFTVLVEYTDFTRYNFDTHGTQLPEGVSKGMFVSDNNMGVYVQIRLFEKTAKKIKGVIDQPVSQVVETINTRLKRGIELDQQHVYEKITESLEKHPTQKKITGELNPMEQVFLWFIIFDKGGWALKTEFCKLLRVDDSNPEELFMALQNLSEQMKAFMVRRIMLEYYASSPIPTTAQAFIIRKIAESYNDIPIAQFESEQKEKRDKRETNAAIKIQALTGVSAPVEVEQDSEIVVDEVAEAA